MILRNYPSLEAAVEVLKRTGYQRENGNLFKHNFEPTPAFPEYVTIKILKKDYPVQVKVVEADE